MKIQLLAIGKTDEAYLVSGIKKYVGRIGHYATFEMKEIPDPRHRKTLSEEEQKKAESLLTLQQLLPTDHVVILDENGQQQGSVAFAESLQKLMAAGIKRLVFIIGGPYGFAQAVYDRANAKMSLSPMTFSHQMVRLIFVEQLYRAFSILKGEPYHHQ